MQNIINIQNAFVVLSLLFFFVHLALFGDFCNPVRPGERVKNSYVKKNIFWLGTQKPLAAISSRASSLLIALFLVSVSLVIGCRTGSTLNYIPVTTFSQSCHGWSCGAMLQNRLSCTKWDAKDQTLTHKHISLAEESASNHS